MTEPTDPPQDATDASAEDAEPVSGSLPVRGDSVPAEDQPAGPHDANADDLIGDLTTPDIDLDYAPAEDVDGGDA